jgi:photosystem II stability/assembly factor-like uncharacterized protein
VLPTDSTPPKSATILRVDSGTSVTISGRLILAGVEDWRDFYWKTEDGGRNWVWSSTVLFDVPSTVLCCGSNPIQSPSDPRVLYKYLPELGLYLRSDDSGSTWQLPRYEVDSTPREDLAYRVAGNRSYRLNFSLAAIHPRQPLTLYAGIDVVPWARTITDAPPLEEHTLPGLYVSGDGGETWKKFSDKLESFDYLFQVIPVGISPSHPDLMYGVCPAGICKSTDGGKGWSAVGEQSLLGEVPRSVEEKRTGRKVLGGRLGLGIAVRQFVFDPLNDKTVYIVSNKGVFRTLDGGETWCLLSLGFDVAYSYYDAALNPSNPKELFVGTAYGLFRSKDRGCHFEKIYPPAQSHGRSRQGK